MAYSALKSVKAAEKEADEIITRARAEVNKTLRMVSTQAERLIEERRSEAIANGNNLKQKTEEAARTEAKTIQQEAKARVSEIKKVSDVKKKAVLSFVAEGIVNKYVSGSYDQDNNPSS